MASISLRLLLAVTAALFAGMLLINIVLLGFWHQDALQRELQCDRLVLSIIKREVKDTGRTVLPALSLAPLLADIAPKDRPDLISIYFVDADPVFSADASSAQMEMLRKCMTEAIATGHPVVHVSGSLLSTLFAGKLTLLSVEPVRRQGKILAAVGIVRVLTSLSLALQKAEKTILIYIVLNVVFLGLLLFFRIRSIVIMPLHRLIDRANQYRDEGSFLITPESSKGEFSLLAGNLNRMVATIENDKNKLQEIVGQLKEANRQLKQQQEEMIQAEKLASVGRMAAGLAHEIGNPIAVVLGYLGLMKSRNLPYAEQEDFINRSERELQRVTALIRQLLDFSRIEGELTQKIALHELLKDLVGMMDGQKYMRDVEIITNFNAEYDIVQGDHKQLYQVFLNLLFNAVDAMARADQKKISIETRCISLENLRVGKPARLLITITDSGEGIAQEDVSRVFDAFFTTKEPGKGTGLGLFVSYNIIDKLGGRIWIESQKGRGATIFVELPLARN